MEYNKKYIIKEKFIERRKSMTNQERDEILVSVVKSVNNLQITVNEMRNEMKNNILYWKNYGLENQKININISTFSL